MLFLHQKKKEKLLQDSRLVGSKHFYSKAQNVGNHNIDYNEDQNTTDSNTMT
jgi:hypothetical protein